MEQKSLARWLKLMILVVAVCCLAVYFLVIPAYGGSLRDEYPEFAYCFWPWVIFLWVSALPVLAALALGWRVAANIGRDASFSMDNARLLRRIAWLAAGDTVYLFLGNLVLLLLGMSHPGIALLLLLAVFVGAAAAVAAGALSHLVQKAARLQEDSDLTI